MIHQTYIQSKRHWTGAITITHHCKLCGKIVDRAKLGTERCKKAGHQQKGKR